MQSKQKNAELLSRYKQFWFYKKTKNQYWDSKKMWEKIQHEIDAHEKGPRYDTVYSFGEKHRRGYGSMLMRIAAVFVLAVGLAWIMHDYIFPVEQQRDTAQVDMVTMTPENRTKLTMSDGTSITLDVGSKIRYPEVFSGNTREFYLEGEGFFKVAPNRERPFIVHTKHADVEVLGTRFNVNVWDKTNSVIKELL